MFRWRSCWKYLTRMDSPLSWRMRCCPKNCFRSCCLYRYPLSLRHLLLLRLRLLRPLPRLPVFWRPLPQLLQRTGRPLRLCKGYFNPLQKPETDLRIQDQYLLEQHCYRRFLLQNQHGFPQTGGKRLLLRTVSGHLLQDRRSSAGKIQSWLHSEKFSCIQRLYHQRTG